MIKQKLVFSWFEFLHAYQYSGINEQRDKYMSKCTYRYLYEYVSMQNHRGMPVYG